MRATFGVARGLSGLVLTMGVLHGCGAQDFTGLGDDYQGEAEASDAGYQDGVPELAAVELRLTGDSEAEGLATEEDAFDAEALVTDEMEEASTMAADDVASDLVEARVAVSNLNQALRSFLQPVVATVRSTEASVARGDVRVWGPVVRGTTVFRFLMRRNASKDYGWLLQARADEDNAAFVSVAAGQLRVGAEKRRGIGKAVFDLDALGGVDPMVGARGMVLVGFAHGENGTTARYGLRGFTRDPDSSEPMDALIQQVRLPGTRYRLRLAYRGDVEGTATEAEELVLARHRHVDGRGGRADLIALGGDIPPDEAWVTSQCWSAQLAAGYRVVRTCPLDGIGGEACSVVSVVGDLEACAAGLEEPELPPSDASEPMVDPEDPNEALDIPESMSEIEAPEE